VAAYQENAAKRSSAEASVNLPETAEACFEILNNLAGVIEPRQQIFEIVGDARFDLFEPTADAVG
jgi:hypothetical protein